MSDGNNNWVFELKVLLFFTAATLFMTSPMIFHMFDSIPGSAGDTMVFFFSIWWYGQEGFGFIDQQVIPYILHPYGVPYHRYGDLAPISVLLLPVIRTLGPTFTYNLSLLLAFILSGYFTFLLVRNITGSWKAGFLSGVFFSFSAYHFSRFGGQLNLMHIEWFPLLLFAIKKAIDTQKAGYFALAGVAYTLMFLSSGYYAYIGALLLISFTFLYLRWSAKKKLPILPALLGVAIPAVLLFPFIYGTMKLKSAGVLSGSIGWTYIHSADILNYLWVNPQSALFGKMVLSLPLKTSIYGEQALYLGLVPLALAAFAAVRLFSSRVEKTPGLAAHAKMFALLGALFLVLSLGPVLKLNNEMLLIPTGGSQQLLIKASELLKMSEKDQQRMLELKGLPVPMPYLVPYFTFPFFNMMRVPSRFGVIVSLSVAILAGIGYSIFEKSMLRRNGRLAGAVFISALLLYSLEIVPSPRPTVSPIARPVDAWLASQPEKFAIIEYPVTIYDCDYLGHIPFHGKNIVNFCSSFVPENARKLVDLVSGFPPSKEAVDFFRQNDVRYVLVDYGAAYGRLDYTGPKESVPNLEFAGKFGEIYVYSPTAP